MKKPRVAGPSPLNWYTARGANHGRKYYGIAGRLDRPCDRTLIHKPQLPGLMHFAVAKPEIVKAGGRTLSMLRLTITDAGRRALVGA
jgi:hypothetical protein